MRLKSIYLLGFLQFNPGIKSLYGPMCKIIFKTFGTLAKNNVR